jgi:peptidoglycan/xylan/chitin deacetylase (PgdA/CDA1 family)
MAAALRTSKAFQWIRCNFFKLWLAFLVSGTVAADDKFAWPDGQKMAVSLSYDDAIDSQLDNAIPALNRHGLAASFYLTLASPTLQRRLMEWRTAAEQGHELGNHTIYHPCSAALPDRDWVASYYNIDDYMIDEIVHEITVANSFLHAIDGRTERTLTVPCGDIMAGDESYIPAVRKLFVAIKGFESQDPAFATTWAPAQVTGPELIDRVKAEAGKGTRLYNIIFHGIGGDYLTVSTEAHEQLLQYLVENEKEFWVDSYINIMKYASENSAPGFFRE